MSTSGVIHDIGYRPYTGQRLGEGYVFRSLYLTSLRNAFGLGRSGKSKILPFVLLGLNLIPMIVIVAVMVATKAQELPFDYAFYVIFVQILVSTFAASQGPVLFSRDLRHGSIVLYLARPMRSATYAIARWLGLATAIFGFIALPVVLMYAGAMLAKLDFGTNTEDMVQTLGFSLVLAVILASVCGLFAALTVRRGFAVVGSIGVLIFGWYVISAIQAIASEEGAAEVGEVAGLFSPFTIYQGMVDGLTDTSASAIVVPDQTMSVLYLAVGLLVGLGGFGLLVLRYRKVAAR
jgi:ABC-2 type transport system permease protein